MDRRQARPSPTMLTPGKSGLREETQSPMLSWTPGCNVPVPLATDAGYETLPNLEPWDDNENLCICPKTSGQVGEPLCSKREDKTCINRPSSATRKCSKELQLADNRRKRSVEEDYDRQTADLTLTLAENEIVKENCRTYMDSSCPTNDLTDPKNTSDVSKNTTQKEELKEKAPEEYEKLTTKTCGGCNDGECEVKVDKFNSNGEPMVCGRQRTHAMLTVCVTTTAGSSRPRHTGYCFISDSCYADDTENPSNECQFCNITESTSEWQDNDEDDGGVIAAAVIVPLLVVGGVGAAIFFYKSQQKRKIMRLRTEGGLFDDTKNTHFKMRVSPPPPEKTFIPPMPYNTPKQTVDPNSVNAPDNLYTDGSRENLLSTVPAPAPMLPAPPVFGGSPATPVVSSSSPAPPLFTGISGTTNLAVNGSPSTPARNGSSPSLRGNGSSSALPDVENSSTPVFTPRNELTPGVTPRNESGVTLSINDETVD
ncbi:hypothetical protein MAR_013382 [Mya arenaria]|uniref:Uncharacterized protein n=1 Tax=Mya arenaria TaxID=6604 RepID=A0ABY7FZP1_MYAAR|nr:hypothetical protein MAR_013382 [Mya arenaria]